VTQVSRWDALKDPVGLLDAFADHGPPEPDVHLLLVGPDDGVADDPESTETFAEVHRRWASLRYPDARRVHLARVPMDDPAENAVVVNAVQRRSDVVVQKSLAEGFGLTVAEAMWKHRPVVASRVGGLQDQILDGASGLLVDDPTDLPAFGAALRRLVRDRPLARQLGDAARQRVRDHFLPVQHAEAEADLLDSVLARPDVAIGMA
jgi:trehalose synthase